MKRMLIRSGLVCLAFATPMTATLMAEANADTASDARSRAKEEREAKARGFETGFARLKFLEGSWTADLAAPNAKPGERSDEGTPIEVVKVKGGKALTTTLETAGYTFLMYFSYDVDLDRYRITSLDDVSGLLDVYEGTFDESGALVVSNVGTGTGYTYLGARHHNRLRLEPNGDTGWKWEIEVTTDLGATWKVQRRVSVKPRTASAAAPAV